MKILSFDIEDWFHILDNPETSNPTSWEKMPSRLEAGVDRILSLLSDTNQPATFFCLGWVVEKHPNVIKKIVNSGNHLGTHSHAHQLAYDQSKNQFEEDLWRSIDTLQQVSGTKIDTYRAPGFSITSKNLWAFEVLYRLVLQLLNQPYENLLLELLHTLYHYRLDLLLIDDHQPLMFYTILY